MRNQAARLTTTFRSDEEGGYILVVCGARFLVDPEPRSQGLLLSTEAEVCPSRWLRRSRRPSYDLRRGLLVSEAAGDP
jgi:hypothetical protein